MLQAHFEAELLFPAQAAPRGAAGPAFPQLNLAFYKPVYNSSSFFLRGPGPLNCMAVFTICIPGCELPPGCLKWDP